MTHYTPTRKPGTLMRLTGPGLSSIRGKNGRKPDASSHLVGVKPSLSKKEVLDLFAKWRNGDEEAGNTIAATHLKFVISECNKLHPRSDSEYLDFINQASGNLYEAMLRFDHTKGYKFTSYLVWFIRRAKNDHRALFACPYKLPESRARNLGLIQRTLSMHFANTGNWMTFNELAEELGLTLNVVKLLYNEARESIEIDSAVGAIRTNTWTDEFTSPSDASGNSTKPAKYDELISNDAMQADGGIIEEERREFLYTLLSVLDDRKQTLLRLRFGLDGEREHTFEEVGDILGFTRQRAKQLQEEALRELRIEAVKLAG